MLTSMVKRVDNAVYDSFMQVKNGTWKAGVTAKGLKEGGVDWALDENNRKLITPEIEKRVTGCPQGHHRRQGQGHRHPFGRRLPGLIPV
jgi:basic membrane lipoprotein Med (substrate-binding protein (PBP1-ABC) superfamily)